MSLILTDDPLKEEATVACFKHLREYYAVWMRFAVRLELAVQPQVTHTYGVEYGAYRFMALGTKA